MITGLTLKWPVSFNGALRRMNGEQIPVAAGLAKANFEPGERLYVTGELGNEFPIQIPQEGIGDNAVLDAPLSEEWINTLDGASHKVAPLGHTLKKQKGKFKRMTMIMAIVGVILGLIVGTQTPEALYGMTPYVFPTMTIFVVGLAMFMDCASRRQKWDAVIALCCLGFNYLLGAHWLIVAANAMVADKFVLDPVAILPIVTFFMGLIGMLVSLLLMYAFAFYGGRDMSAPAGVWAMLAIGMPFLGWGAIGAALPFLPEDMLGAIFALALALIHYGFDLFANPFGEERWDTLSMTAVFLVIFYFGNNYFLSKGVPMWVTWVIIIALNFAFAALGSSYSEETEQKEGFFSGMINVLDKLARQNQFDSVAITAVLLFGAHLVGLV